jgi:hypothetical protein
MSFKRKFRGLQGLDLDSVWSEEKYKDRRFGYVYIYHIPIIELYKGNQKVLSIFCCFLLLTV